MNCYSVGKGSTTQLSVVLLKNSNDNRHSEIQFQRQGNCSSLPAALSPACGFSRFLCGGPASAGEVTSEELNILHVEPAWLRQVEQNRRSASGDSVRARAHHSRGMKTGFLGIREPYSLGAS